jgi:hypothetical protein
VPRTPGLSNNRQRSKLHVVLPDDLDIYINEESGRRNVTLSSIAIELMQAGYRVKHTLQLELRIATLEAKVRDLCR